MMMRATTVMAVICLYAADASFPEDNTKQGASAALRGYSVAQQRDTLQLKQSIHSNHMSRQPASPPLKDSPQAMQPKDREMEEQAVASHSPARLQEKQSIHSNHMSRQPASPPLKDSPQAMQPKDREMEEQAVASHSPIRVSQQAKSVSPRLTSPQLRSSASPKGRAMGLQGFKEQDDMQSESRISGQPWEPKPFPWARQASPQHPEDPSQELMHSGFAFWDLLPWARQSPDYTLSAQLGPVSEQAQLELPVDDGSAEPGHSGFKLWDFLPSLPWARPSPADTPAGPSSALHSRPADQLRESTVSPPRPEVGELDAFPGKASVPPQEHSGFLQSGKPWEPLSFPLHQYPLSDVSLPGENRKLAHVSGKRHFLPAQPSGADDVSAP